MLQGGAHEPRKADHLSKLEGAGDRVLPGDPRGTWRRQHFQPRAVPDSQPPGQGAKEVHSHGFKPLSVWQFLPAARGISHNGTGYL